MANGFSVDLGALGGAVDGINDTLDEVQAHDVKAINCGDSAYGHDRLAGIVADFCDRWDLGVQNLATDGQTIADRLNTAMQAYEEADQNLAQVFTGIGPDPAAGA
jgi:hypothetical protein